MIFKEKSSNYRIEITRLLKYSSSACAIKELISLIENKFFSKYGLLPIFTLTFKPIYTFALSTNEHKPISNSTL